jgi:hypothetical protein
MFLRKAVGLCSLICLSGCNGLHFRPNNVPHSAVWADGTFIECSIETQAKADHCTVYKGDTGEILADGLFLLNMSGVAADESELHYAAFGNGTIYLSDARRLVLWIPSERDPTHSIINGRLKELAGGGTAAIECRDEKDRFGAAADCALRAFADGRPFYAKYYRQGIDSFSFTGVAGDASGNIYEMDYDSLGWRGLTLPKEARLLDGNHTLVMPCPRPIHLAKDAVGKLTCSRSVN